MSDTTPQPTAPSIELANRPIAAPVVHQVPAGWHLDYSSGRMRWWDGTKWTENFAPAPMFAVATTANGAGTAALVLGILGFLFMPIPFFIGWFIGGPLDIAAVIFAIVALSKPAPAAKAAATWGLVLAGVSLLSVFIGAGSIW